MINTEDKHTEYSDIRRRIIKRKIEMTVMAENIKKLSSQIEEQFNEFFEEVNENTLEGEKVYNG